MPPKLGRKRKVDKDSGDDHEKKSKIFKEEQQTQAVEKESKIKKALFEDAEARSYWLVKSEPNKRTVKDVDISFSIKDLMDEDHQTASWDGVRNFESRNNLKGMKVGDLALFYHSNCRDPGVVGIVEIVRAAYPDESQFDEKSPYFDSNSDVNDPKWVAVDVKFVRAFNTVVTFAELKRHRADLGNMALFNKLRLSVQPVTKEQFDYILQLDLKHKGQEGQ